MLLMSQISNKAMWLTNLIIHMVEYCYTPCIYIYFL